MQCKEVLIYRRKTADEVRIIPAGRLFQCEALLFPSSVRQAGKTEDAGARSGSCQYYCAGSRITLSSILMRHVMPQPKAFAFCSQSNQSRHRLVHQLSADRAAVA